MSLMLVSQGTGLLTWQSGSSSGVGLTGPVYLAANVGYVLPFNPNGWFQTGVETLLNANLTTSTSIGGFITFYEGELAIEKNREGKEIQVYKRTNILERQEIDFNSREEAIKFLNKELSKKGNCIKEQSNGNI